ncbi:MAG: MBL fold metallo-hydrolase [Synergistaceae bacterium]|jgi:phosphoribosyl 1,2-cyclic phosphodiesterase|nr:MBL fold metallo-hydrolase [Synergistaceae bacterium]
MKNESELYPGNFIRFLGTAGTRFVMLSQRRSSGGIWFSYGGAMGVIDPGPGSLVQICAASPPLSAIDIDTLILTHRHIDHSSDLNVLVEGMTLRASEPRGRVILTEDCLEPGDSVILRYESRRVELIHTHADEARTEISNRVSVESVLHKHHGVQCYGLIFRGDGLPSWGLISDTVALPNFSARYSECELLVINVAMPLPRARLDHMSIPDVESLLQALYPKLAIITHMGGFLLDMGPEEIAASLSTERTSVAAAQDGMVVDLEAAGGLAGLHRGGAMRSPRDFLRERPNIYQGLKIL